MSNVCRLICWSLCYVSISLKFYVKFNTYFEHTHHFIELIWQWHDFDSNFMCGKNWKLKIAIDIFCWLSHRNQINWKSVTAQSLKEHINLNTLMTSIKTCTRFLCVQIKVLHLQPKLHIFIKHILKLEADDLVHIVTINSQPTVNIANTLCVFYV